MFRIALSLFVFTAAACALELRVSPEGTLASLAAARDAVRAARMSGDQSDARVIIADGIYPLTEPVVFEPQDSRVTYEAAPKAKPLFTGGRQITGWKVEGGVWTVKVDPAWRFEALWIMGQRTTRARTPNAGFHQAVGQPLQLLPEVQSKGDPTRSMLQIEPENAAPLAQLPPEELHEVNVIVHFSWDEQRHRLAGVRATDGTLQFTAGLHRAFFSLEPYHNVRLENFRAALDAPGEWFLALDGTLSYLPRPGETPDKADAWAPMAAQWLVLKGDAEKDAPVEKLTFRGLHFAHQAWTLPPEGAGYGQAEATLGAAIEADGARDIAFEQCEFAHTLTNAAWFRHGCRDIALRQCRIHDLGAGGVKIGETGVPKDERGLTSHVLLDNCIIHGGGRYFPAGIGVWIGQNPDNTIRHCDIADFFYSTISIGWVWGYHPTPCARNLVEHCHLHHFGWGVLSDMGAVYTLGPQPGTIIRGCHVHDVACSSYGGWGLYTDEGSTGTLWENNLVYRTQSGGFHQHYGRGNIVRNNIFAFNQEFQIRWSKPEEFLGLAFENNIVLFDEGKLFGHVDKNWFTGHVWVNRNVYWQVGGKPFDFAGKTWADWQFFGHDPESIVADPLFIAPEKGDWTLRPESPALKLGFKPFDWHKAGVTGDEAWRKLASVEYPPVTFSTKPKPRPLTLHEDFETTPLGAKPAHGARVSKTLNGIMAVVQGGSKGERCLELRDAPEITPAFEPHFYYYPHHDTGSTRVAFDVKLEPAYALNYEWRDDAQPYRTGPQLTFEQGAVKANGRKLIDLPAAGWLHVEVEAKLGDKCDGTWTCTLTAQDQPTQKFNDLKFLKPGMRKLDWLGWSSNAKSSAKAWIDEIMIENKP
jgi:hypothetical protein